MSGAFVRLHTFHHRPNLAHLEDVQVGGCMCSSSGATLKIDQELFSE